MPNEPTRKPAQQKPTPRLEQRADKHARGSEVVTMRGELNLNSDY